MISTLRSAAASTARALPRAAAGASRARSPLVAAAFFGAAAGLGAVSTPALSAPRESSADRINQIEKRVNRLELQLCAPSLETLQRQVGG
jgi:hypothetical protein